VCTEPNGVKSKIREHKLRIGVNCQEVLKEIGVKRMCVQQGLVAYNPVKEIRHFSKLLFNHKI
jgi:DNA-directed RNA polymerase subunit N (RpoN/RPB10)